MTAAANAKSEPIPGYRLCERIGAGGYGEVWRCEAPGELVKAIKLVYGRLDDDRAARELKALQRVKSMRHPFLLSLERIEVVDGQLIIVTELADGSLKDCFDQYRAQKQTGIPVDELLGYLDDAADALDYMSEKHSLQHLDVKPENLLLVGGHVKVADFGLVKEIQEVTASIMGGLTPLYAPPEVFDGQPTKLSDQYSLAIVFQEMLTSVLPFPGKTAAQLAAQHLNAKPRLAALPAMYQPIIGRALSKKPTDRYTSCRELVRQLHDARRQEQDEANGIVAPRSTQRLAPVRPPVNPGGETFRIDPDADPASSPAPTEPESSIRTPDMMMDELNHATATASWLLENEQVSAQPTFAEESRPLQDLPPVEFDPSKWTARPTLFVGVGGAGKQALAGLKQRWKDHFAAGGPPAQVLAIDLEPRGMSSASATLDASETIEIPLRKAQDYRRDNGKLQSWLSRRWLFNIPRSQLTDGIRPLGRLAFVDHCDRIRDAINTALTSLLASDREAAPQDAKGVTNMPRVVLVGAIGGGTGGGILVDLAFLLRQALDQHNCHSSELLLVMAHGTSRNPATQELAAASAYSTLTELGFFTKPGLGYPGDSSCGIKPRQAQQSLLDGAYLVHLGEEMSPAAYDKALTRLSAFLFLEAATPAGGYLSAVRRTDDPLQDTLGRRLTVRSVALCQMGFSQDSLVTQLAENVCRETINRWIGTPRPEAKTARQNLLPPARSTSPPGAELDAQIDEAARTLIKQFQLDEDYLTAMVNAILEQELADREKLIQSLTADVDPQARPGQPSLPPLIRVNQLCGERDERGDLPETASAPLRQTLTEKVRQLSRPIGERMRHALEQLIENPQVRLYGAARAVRVVQGHLRALADQLRETRKQLNGEICSLEAWMCPPADPRQKTKRNPADEAAHRRLYCDKRLDDAVAATVQQVIGALQSYIGQTNDLLVDLDRELRGWQDEFNLVETVDEPQQQPADDEEGSAAIRESSPLDPVRQIIMHELQQRVGTLAKAIDQRVTADVFAQQGGMKGVLLKGGLLRNQLASTVRQHARRGILHLLRTIDIARLLAEGIPGHTAANNLFGEALRSAEPWLQTLGGNRRLVCITPPEHAARWTSEKLTKLTNSYGFANAPAVLTNCGSDSVLLYELGDLSLRRVATAIIDSRPDLADLAKRLHTRTDVNWQPLP